MSKSLSRRLVPALVALLTASLTLNSPAATPGSIDPSFDPGSGIAPITDFLPVRVIFPLPDGSFLLGGYFTNYNGVTRLGLAKVLENGALDEAFVPDPSFSMRTEVWGISQQGDGKFIVCGFSGSPSVAKIVRINPDGSLDPTFVFVKGRANFAMAVQVRPDGLIAYLTDDNQGLGLLNPDGSRLLNAVTLYPPFGLFDRVRVAADGNTFYSHNAGLFRFSGSFGSPDESPFPVGNAAIYDFDFQSDGGIVCAQNSGVRSVRRYFANGVLDTNFVSKVGGPDLNALVCLPDDKVLVGGTFSGVGTVAIRNLARLNSNGSLDTNFVTGAGPNSTICAIAPLQNGKALIAGKFTSYDGFSRTGVARIFLDPPATPAFVTQPKSTTVFEGQPIRLSAAVNAASPIAYQWKKDGQAISGATNSVLYIASGQQTNAGSYVLEVTTPSGSATSLEAIVSLAAAPVGIGSPDPAFAVGEGASGAVNAYLDLANGKSLVAGNFSAYDGYYQPALVRLNADGSLDPSLNLNLPSNVACTRLAKLSDRKILAGFISARSGTTNIPVLLRLNADGSPDAAFFPNSSSDILTIAPLPDGKALIGGAFTSLGGFTRTRLARLNDDGAIDESFDANALRLTKVYALAVQPDGKIIVGDEKRVLRISADGAPEADLPLTTGSSQGIRALALQADGKILVGGRFTAINGIGRTNLARLNTDMTLDFGFSAAAGARNVTSSSVLSFAIQPDQKIFVGGNFSDLAGVTVTNIARLLPTGALDTTFTADVNLGNATTRVAVNTLSLSGDNALIIGGLFSRVNGYTRNSLARIYTTTPPPTLGAAAVFSATSHSIRLSLPSNSSSYVLQFTDQFPANWQDTGVPLNNADQIEMQLIGSQRFYRLLRNP